MAQHVQHFINVTLSAVILGFLVLYVRFFVYGPNWWDSCAVNRFDASYVNNNATNHLIMNITQILVFFVAFQVPFWKYNTPKKQSRILSSFITYSAAFDIIYVILWFISTYMLVVFLKDYMGDNICNNKSNR